MAVSGTTAELTEQQRLAITTRGVSIGLSAGAGCGKTFVLTERFLSYLGPGQGAELHELVALTFTDKAAREMRERIRKACRRQLEQAAAEQSPHWRRLVRQLDTARISTIHAFCANLLRSHAVEAQLDPAFQVLDELGQAALQREVVDDALRQLLADQDQRLMRLVSAYTFRVTRVMIDDLLRKRHDIDFDRWEGATAGELVARWTAFASQVEADAVRRVAETHEANDTRELLRGPLPHDPKALERFERLADLLQLLVRGDGTSATLAEIQELAKVQGIPKKSWPTEQVHSACRDTFTALRKVCGKVVESCDFEPAKALPSAEAGLALLSLLRQIAEAYDNEKRDQGFLDFDDLMVHAARLLDNDDHGLRSRLAGHLRLLLVDEFQDTDQVQVNLIKSLCDRQHTDGKLFFVGDRKQSIYRFRGAKPQVFHELRSELHHGGRLTLSHNFRSQPAILYFVNALFADEFEGEAPLVPRRAQVTAEPAIEFLWKPVEDRRNDAGAIDASRAAEADWIARRLRGMIDRQEPLAAHARGQAPEARPVRPGDICILLRALSDVHHYEQALEAHGLDYYLVGGSAFYAQQEVFDLRNLLRAVECPADTAALAGALRSPYFSLSDEALFWLAQHRAGLREGLLDATLPEELGAEDRQRAAFAADVLRELERVKDRLPVAELIQRALALTGYDALLLAEFLGQRKLGNLRQLVGHARVLDGTGVFSLSDFVTQLTENLASEPREAQAATHAEDADVIRLMTIHQAKGLEFPVVVVADLDRRPNTQLSPAVYHPELGPLVRSSAVETDTEEDDEQGGQKKAKKKPRSGHDLYRVEYEAEEDEEALRLFYVACTRAADYLILSSARFEGKPSSPSMKLLARRFDLDSGELLVSLPDELAPPQVLVTNTEPPLDSRTQSRRSRIDPVRAAELVDQSTSGAPPVSVAPVPVDGRALRQFSFSQLSGLLEAAEPAVDEEERNDGGRGRGAGGLRLGTLAHALLAEFPWPSADWLSTRLGRQAEMLGAGSAEHQAAALEMLRRFEQMPSAAELRSAKVRHAELDFLLAWPPGASTGGINLWGVIDAVYQDAAGNWHLIDYKTNAIPAAGPASLLERYRLQMLVYALAVESLLGRPPASVRLVLLDGGLELPVICDSAALDQARREIDSALAKLRGN